jgi:hypothetical protein
MRHARALPRQCITHPIPIAGTSVKKGGTSAAAAILEDMSARQMQHMTDATEANRREQAESQAQFLQAFTSSTAFSQQSSQKQLELEEAQLKVQQQALLLKQQEQEYTLSMRPQQEHHQMCLNAKAGTETLMTMLSGDLPPDLRNHVIQQLYKLAAFSFLPVTPQAAPPPNHLPAAAATVQLSQPTLGAKQATAVAPGAAFAGIPNTSMQAPCPATLPPAVPVTNLYPGTQSQPTVMQPGAGLVPGAYYGVQLQTAHMPHDANVIQDPNSSNQDPAAEAP